MKAYLANKIKEAEEAAAENATQAASDQASPTKRRRAAGGAGESGGDALQAKAALARWILQCRLLDRIKRYVWGISEFENDPVARSEHRSAITVDDEASV